MLLIPVAEFTAEIAILIGYIFLYAKFSDLVWKITSSFSIRSLTAILFFALLSAIILFGQYLVVKTTISVVDKLDL